MALDAWYAVSPVPLHSNETYDSLRVRQGKDVFTSFTLIFQSKMQSYLFAISREIPVQLFRLQADWQLKFGCGVDTRQISAQDSEHLNLIFKEVEIHERPSPGER
jgi:hypothetical protein